MRDFYLARFDAVALTSFIPQFPISPSTVLLYVSLGLLTPRCPWGFHSRDCLLIASGGFLSVWSIHLHFRLLICCSMRSSPVISQSVSFLIVSRINIFLRHRLMFAFDVIVSYPDFRPVKRPYFTFEYSQLGFPWDILVSPYGIQLHKSCICLLYP